MLIVDDNATSGQFLQEQLVAWRIRSSIATTGSDALDCLHMAAQEKDPFLLAIIDLDMPNIDGRMLAREIKAKPEIAGTQVILLAGFGRRISPEELRDGGIAECCFKPVRQSTLFDYLTNALLKSSAALRSTAVSEARPEPHKALVLIAEDNAVNQTVAMMQLNGSVTPQRP